MRTLLLHAPAELRVQVLACQLAMARSKPLLALRALRKALIGGRRGESDVSLTFPSVRCGRFKSAPRWSMRGGGT